MTTNGFPRIVVAGTHSGTGKTSVAVALVAALSFAAACAPGPEGVHAR